MTKHAPHAPLPEGSVAAPDVAIGGLSLAVAAGFQFLGVAPRLDDWLQDRVVSFGLGGSFEWLPGWVGWIPAVLIAFGLPFAMLKSPGLWRRAVLWISTLVVLAGWVPVMALSMKWCAVGPSLVAALWGGLCALVYGLRHHMPCDAPLSAKPVKTD